MTKRKTERKLEVKVIRMVKVEGEVYIHKDDVVDAIMAARKMAGSLNAKADLKVLAEEFAGGEVIEK